MLVQLKGRRKPDDRDERVTPFKAAPTDRCYAARLFRCGEAEGPMNDAAEGPGAELFVEIVHPSIFDRETARRTVVGAART
jgi:hypothetical protein